MNLLTITKRSALLSLVVLLVACATLHEQSSQRLAIKPGDTIRVNSSLAISAGNARVYMQHGRVTLKSDLDFYGTYCSVQMNKLQKTGATQLQVEPGEFRVIKITETDDLTFSQRSYASQQNFLHFPVNVLYRSEMRLESSEQPEVRAIFCNKREGVYIYKKDERFPNRAQIRQALGDLIGIPREPDRE
jgi:hypothetical protein